MRPELVMLRIRFRRTSGEPWGGGTGVSSSSKFSRCQSMVSFQSGAQVVFRFVSEQSPRLVKRRHANGNIRER